MVPKSVVVAYPDAGVRTALMSALRQDGWETIGAHSGGEVVRWLAVADLAQKPLPSLLVLGSGLRVHGVPISRAIATSVGTASVLYLDDEYNEAMADYVGTSRASVARWPLDLDDFRTMVQLLLERPPQTRVPAPWNASAASRW